MASAVPPARPRPRPRRRKSYPDRLSNGVRLSLLEAMNRLSQESTSLDRHSAQSRTDGTNRLSMASQTSGHTLFYDVEADGEGRVVSGDQDSQQHTSVLATQSLEALSSTLTRTGIEVVHPVGRGDLGAPPDDERRGKRNVRMVRISDTIQVSPPPGPRRRKLTKSRPAPARGSTPGPAPRTGLPTAKETTVQTQKHERRGSFLPWISKGSSSDSKGGAAGSRSGAASESAGERRGEDGPPSTPTKGLVHPNETTIPTPALHSPVPIANGSISSPTEVKSNSPTKKPISDSPTPTPSTTPRKARRYTFSLLPSHAFHRSKHEKSNTAGADLGPYQHANTKGKPKESSIKAVESGTDSTSTSIRTITQGSQSTLTPTSPGLYDLTTLTSSGQSTGSSGVPMLRRLNAQEIATGVVSAQSEWDSARDSTPSLTASGSTATSSSGPRTIPVPSIVRLLGGELFVPQPSGLKESHTDMFEEDDLEGVHSAEERERTPKVCVHRRQDLRAGAGGAMTFEEDERTHLQARSNSGLSLSPSPRPGTPSSTLTTATETSGSYVSFSTLPASTTSSSTSPSLTMGDKRDYVVSVPLGGGGKGGDGDVCTCALCGQLVPASMSPTCEPDQAEMHPMFTVPLVTVPASAYPRARDASTAMGMGTGSDARYVSRRKGEGHISVPVPAGVGVVPAMNGQGHHHNLNHVHVHVNGSVPVPAAARMAMAPSPPPLASPPKVRKRRRPQTAPPGMGAAESKFIEGTRLMHVREGTGDGHVGIGVGGDRTTKYRAGNGSGGSGESKFKTVLKGLLRWHG